MVISTIQLHRGMVHAKRHFEFNSTTQTAFFSHQSIDSDISVTWGKITRRAIDKKKCFFVLFFLQSWYQSNFENLSVGFFYQSYAYNVSWRQSSWTTHPCQKSQSYWTYKQNILRYIFQFNIHVFYMLFRLSLNCWNLVDVAMTLRHHLNLFLQWIKERRNLDLSERHFLYCSPCTRHAKFKHKLNIVLQSIN